MKLEYLFIGGFTLSLVITLGALFFTDLLNTYSPYNPELDLGAVGDLNNIADNTVQIYSSEDSMKGYLTGSEVSDEDAENEMFQGGYTAIRTNPYTVKDVISNSTTIMQETTAGVLPAEVWKYAISVLAVLITFGVLYLIFRIPNN